MWKYTAVLIEPRKHKALEFVLRNFIENLSDEWKFLIFHGRQNKEFIQEIILRNEFEDRIDKLIQLDVDNLSIAQYNRMLINPSFYKCILTEIMLIFQTDTLILRENRDLINDFLEYDYVGSPWKNVEMVGNGGLSLRRKSKMIEICQHYEYMMKDPEVNKKLTKILDENNEDVMISLQKIIYINTPEFKKAVYFGMETVYNERSFGIHSIWSHFTEKEMEEVLKRYPEIKIVMELNKL